MSEPDRFEAKARGLLMQVQSGPMVFEPDQRHVAGVAAALRQAEASALERAAQEYGAEDLANIKVYCRHVAQRLRELKSPAAAPARHHFETCPHGFHMEVCKDAPAQGAEAPNPERDRNQHNAMLVEAWRGEFGALCKALFPGNDGPIGWKHIHAKIAELLAARAAPHAKGEGT